MTSTDSRISGYCWTRHHKQCVGCACPCHTMDPEFRAGGKVLPQKGSNDTQ